LLKVEAGKVSQGSQRGETERWAVNRTITWETRDGEKVLAIEWVAFSDNRRKMHWVQATSVPVQAQELMERPGRWVRDGDGQWRPTATVSGGGRRVQQVPRKCVDCLLMFIES
jgi:hypothetical protein